MTASCLKAIGILLALTISVVGTAPAAALDQRAVLTLRVNTVSKFDVTVKLSGSDVLVRRKDLDAAGVSGFDFRGKDSQDYISLRSLGDGLTFTVDDKALTLNITVGIQHLALSTFDYHEQGAYVLSKPVRSAFLNYSLSFSPNFGVGLSTQLGTQLGAGTLTTTASVAGRARSVFLTQWLMDAPTLNKRITVGDVQISTGDLGGSASLFGAVVERYFGLNPNAISTVLPGIRGSVDTPATADIYINGALVRQETLPPGQFYFQNLPVGSGPNNTQVIVTDAFGKQVTYGNYFYGADQLLAPGVTNFAYGFGVPSNSYGSASVRPGPLVAGRYSVGLTQNVTAGARIEATDSFESVGAQGVVRLHNGVVGAALAGSHDGTKAGTAVALSYQTVSRRINVSASLLEQSPHYATVSLPYSADRPISNAALTLSLLTGTQGSVGLTYSAQVDRDQRPQDMWQISRWLTLSHNVMLELDANRTRGALGQQLGFATSIQLIPRPGVSANFNASESGGQRELSANVSSSSSNQTPSLGYTAGIAALGGGASGYATGQYRWQYGNYFTSLAFGGGNTQLSFQAAGGLVALGGTIMPTQPVGESYALVDTGGLSNVRVLANGIEVGRTDARGYALVPALGSYVDNKVTILPGDVPLNYEINNTEQHVTPEYLSGHVLHFSVKRVVPVFGVVSVDINGRSAIPAFGIIEIEGASHKTSDIGEGGEFYFEDLAPGTYPARIRFKAGYCNFPLNVPNANTAVIKLGKVTCKNGVSS